MTCQIVISAGVWVLVYTCSVLSASFDLNDGDGGDILHLSGPKLELMRPSFVKLSTHWPCYICIDTILITVFWFQKNWQKNAPSPNRNWFIYLLCALVKKTFWELEMYWPAHRLQYYIDHRRRWEPISWLQSHFMVVQPQLTHLQPTYCQWLLRDGWTNIVRMILKLRPGGLLIGGPPCSSWVWINRATSKRSAQRVMGDSSRNYVRDANSILSSTWAIVFFYPLICGNKFNCYNMIFLHLILVDVITRHDNLLIYFRIFAMPFPMWWSLCSPATIASKDNMPLGTSWIACGSPLLPVLNWAAKVQSHAFNGLREICSPGHPPHVLVYGVIVGCSRVWFVFPLAACCSFIYCLLSWWWVVAITQCMFPGFGCHSFSAKSIHVIQCLELVVWIKN